MRFSDHVALRMLEVLLRICFKEVSHLCFQAMVPTMAQPEL